MQPGLLNQLRQIGQASFFSYVVQFHLYSVLLPKLPLPYTHAWPLLFLLSLAMLAVAARAWNSVEGNRFLTVGIGPFLERRARLRRQKSQPEIALNVRVAAESANASTGARGPIPAPDYSPLRDSRKQTHIAGV